jgi:hypothetical protein
VDPFEVLGVGPDASEVEIRRAFSTAVRAAHPDAGGAPAGAAARLAELIRARDLALHPVPPARPSRPRVEVYHRASGLERVVGVVLASLARSGRGGRRRGRNLR